MVKPCNRIDKIRVKAKKKMAIVQGTLNIYLGKYFSVRNGEFHPVLRRLLPSGVKSHLSSCSLLAVRSY